MATTTFSGPVNANNGFVAYSFNDASIIIADIDNGIKLPAIAAKYNIKYFNLSNWRRKNNLIIC